MALDCVENLVFELGIFDLLIDSGCGWSGPQVKTPHDTERVDPIGHEIRWVQVPMDDFQYSEDPSDSPLRHDSKAETPSKRNPDPRPSRIPKHDAPKQAVGTIRTS